jgi:peptide/nickel transport system substrate-binding protein
MKRLWWLFLTLALVSAMLLSSCGKTEVTTSAPATSTTTSTTTTAATTAATTATTTATTGAELVKDSLGRMITKPQYGGTYTYCVAADIYGFDNAYTYPYLTTTLNITNEPLWAGDWSKGPAGTGDASWQILGVTFLKLSIGRLAESYEIPDNQTIIYHIRQGVHFQNKPPVNGRELDAYDVEYSLNRCFQTPGSYLNFTYTGADAPTSIKAIDQWTLKITCNVGKQGPLFIVTAGYIDIFPRDGVPAGGNFKDWKTSNGTGAFMMTDYVPNSSSTYVKNENYWMTDPLIPGNKLPYVDKILRLVIPDPSTIVSALKTGKIDSYQGITWDVAVALKKTNPELKSGSYLPSYSWSIHMALGKGFPWDDINVRHAMSMAIDRQKILNDFYGGNAVDFTFPIMPYPEESGMFTPLNQLPQDVQNLYKHDVTAAKALMVQAGQPSGFSAEIICTTATPQYLDLLSLIKSMWADINVNLTIMPLENAVWTAQVNARTFKNMAYWYDGNSAPYKMNNWRPGNPQNAGNIVSPQLVDVYNQLNTLYPFDQAAADKLIKDQTPYILQQCWIITPPLPLVFWFAQPWLGNYNGEVTLGYYQSENTTAYRWIDRAMKVKMVGHD